MRNSAMTIRSIYFLFSFFTICVVSENLHRYLKFEDLEDDAKEPQWFWNFSAPTSREYKIWGETSNEMYGSSVSIWDNLMLVGAQGDNSGNYQTGAAYVYFKYGTENSEWQLFYVLNPDDGQDGDRFGCAVSLGDHTAVIGASNHDAMGQDSGAAYLYERNQMTAQNARNGMTVLEYNDQSHLNFVMKLVPEDGSGQDYFGAAVAAHVNTTVVGAWGCDALGTLAGCVYVWRKHFVNNVHGEWTFKQKVVASDGTGYQRFGTSVSLYKDVIVVGAPGDSDFLGSEVGAAYVFDQLYDDNEYDGRSWQEHAKLTPSDGGHYDLFGQSVSVWENSILVGAPQHMVVGKKSRVGNAGSVYSYTHTLDKRYFLVEEIEPLHPIENGKFGYAVDIYERMAAIGEFMEGGSGSVYIFREDEKEVYRTSIGHWIFDAQRKSSQGIDGDMYGYCVSIYEANLAVGAYGSSMASEDPNSGTNMYNNGGVYLYTGTYATVPEPVYAEEVDTLDMTVVALISCMVVVGISCVAVICMYQDFKNGMARNIDTIQYELANLDTSHGNGSVLIPPSKHGYPGGRNQPLGRIDPLPGQGSSIAGPAINPLHVNPSCTPPLRAVDNLDKSSGTKLDVSLRGNSTHEKMKRSPAAEYGPARSVMDASIREGSSRNSRNKGQANGPNSGQ